MFFFLIHMDLWSPCAHETTSGCKYFIIIIDDNSRVFWTFVMPTKHHIFQHFTQSYAYVHNQFQTSIKQF